MKKSILFFGLMLFSVMSFAGPSFNCAKAGNTAEHLICGNGELGEMDKILSDNYKRALSNGIDVKADQKQWIKERNLCTNENCLEVSYSNRNDLLIAELQERNLPYDNYDSLNPQGAYAVGDDDTEEDNNESAPVTQSPTPPYRITRSYNYNKIMKVMEYEYRVISTTNGLLINNIDINEGACGFNGKKFNSVLDFGKGIKFNILDTGYCTVIKIDIYTNKGNYTHEITY